MAAQDGVALWDAEGDDDAFQKELDGAVAEKPAREPSGGRDSGKKPRAAQAREERRLDGADYLSRHGLSHSGAPAARAASPEPARSPKSVYVSGLTWWTTDAELEALASQFGAVERVKFFEDKVNGKSKGYARVEFNTPEAAVACKDGIQGKTLHGKQPVVAFPPPTGARDAGGAARGAAEVDPRWSQPPPVWQPPAAGRGGPQWGGPPPGWHGQPGMGGPFPPWGGPGRGGPFPGAMGMPGYGPMPGMAPGYRPPFYPGNGQQEMGRHDGGGHATQDRGKDKKKRHRDDEPKEKSRRRDRYSRSRSRSRSR